MGSITTTEAARRLGVSTERVIFFIRSGRLPATRFGPVWAIQETDLEQLVRLPPGRPPRARAEG